MCSASLLHYIACLVMWNNCLNTIPDSTSRNNPHNLFFKHFSHKIHVYGKMSTAYNL